MTARWMDTYTRIDAGTGRECPLQDQDWPNNSGAPAMTTEEKTTLLLAYDFVVGERAQRATLG